MHTHRALARWGVRQEHLKEQGYHERQQSTQQKFKSAGSPQSTARFPASRSLALHGGSQLPFSSQLTRYVWPPWCYLDSFLSRHRQWAVLVYTASYLTSVRSPLDLRLRSPVTIAPALLWCIHAVQTPATLRTSQEKMHRKNWGSCSLEQSKAKPVSAQQLRRESFELQLASAIILPFKHLAARSVSLPVSQRKPESWEPCCMLFLPSNVPMRKPH